MAYQSFSTLTLVSLLCTAPIRAQSTSHLHDTCVYSFSVPKAQVRQSLLGSGCPGMMQMEQEFEGLKRTVRLQQEQIAAMMTQQSLTAVESSRRVDELLRLLQESTNFNYSGSINTKPSTAPNEPPSQGAVTYIRWGRTICPAHAQTLYVGYAGGAHYTVKGGGANYLCLPQTPEWTNKTVDGSQGGSSIYGTEYELGSLPQFSKEHNSGQTLQDHNIPCVACHVPQRLAQIMIPGLVKCPVGWTIEYKGYIVAEHYTHEHSAVYECLDEAPEVVNGGKANLNGALMHLVEVQCGSLPCPKYGNGWELSCVVCTK